MRNLEVKIPARHTEQGNPFMVDLHLQQLTNQPIRTDNKASYFEIARWICVSAAFVSLVLAYAWTHNEILNIQYGMEYLRKENNKLLEFNTVLRAEYSSLLNPVNIGKQAREIGLVSSTHTKIKIFNSEIPPEKKSRNIVAQSQLQKKNLHE